MTSQIHLRDLSKIPLLPIVQKPDNRLNVQDRIDRFSPNWHSTFMNDIRAIRTLTINTPLFEIAKKIARFAAAILCIAPVALASFLTKNFATIEELQKPGSEFSLRIKNMPKDSVKIGQTGTNYTLYCIEEKDKSPFFVVSLHLPKFNPKAPNHNIDRLEAIGREIAPLTHGKKVIFGGDFNIPYEKNDALKALIDKYQDMKILIGEKRVRKARSSDLTKNPQAAYDNRIKETDSMFIMCGQDTLIDPSLPYPVLDRNTPKDKIRGPQKVVNAFSEEVFLDHQPMSINYRGISLTFGNAANVRDQRRGIVSTAYEIPPTETEEQAAKGWLQDCLAHLLSEIALSEEAAALHELVKDDAQHFFRKDLTDLSLQPIFGKTEDRKLSEAQEKILKRYLFKLYDNLMFLIEKTKAYRNTTYKETYRGLFVDNAFNELIRRFPEKNNLTYVSNTFFSELNIGGIGGFEISDRLAYSDPNQVHAHFVDGLLGDMKKGLLFLSEDKVPQGN